MALLINDPIDILLDADGDIDLTAGGPRLSAGVAAVTQGLRIATQLTKGEWFANRDVGVPWFETDIVPASAAILGQKYSQVKVLAAMRAAIMSVPGVGSIDLLTSTFDGPTRAMRIAWSVKTTFGDTVTDALTLET